MDGVLSRDLRALGIVELVTQRAAPRRELWLGTGLGLGSGLGSGLGLGLGLGLAQGSPGS